MHRAAALALTRARWARAASTSEHNRVTRKRHKGPQGPRTEGPGGPRPRPQGQGVRDSGEAPRTGAGGRPERRAVEGAGGARPWERNRRRGAAPGYKPAGDAQLIWGFHSVREALRAGRRKVVALRATSAAAEKLAAEIAACGTPASIVTAEEIDALLPDGAVHQGLLLEAGPLPEIGVEDLPDDGLVLVLDQVTDPHNVGAILRTAAAFGVNAVITTERHSPALGGVLAKAASGGLEHVDVVSVVNLARALEKLGDMGYQRVGLDFDGPQSLGDTVLSRPLALVLGAEGKGLRRLSRENCDALARIDLPGAVRSLNVSNACAVALTIATMRLAR